MIGRFICEKFTKGGGGKAHSQIKKTKKICFAEDASSTMKVSKKSLRICTRTDAGSESLDSTYHLAVVLCNNLNLLYNLNLEIVQLYTIYKQ